MPTELKVPKLGMDMEEASILRWLVEEGAEVEKGDPVLEIDTDKVAYEVEANADGTIHGLKGEAGETVPVGATLAFIAAPGEEAREPADGLDKSAGDGSAPGVEGREAPASDGGAATLRAADGLEPADGRDARRRVRASPAARRAAAVRGMTIGSIAGSGSIGLV